MIGLLKSILVLNPDADCTDGPFAAICGFFAPARFPILYLRRISYAAGLCAWESSLPNIWIARNVDEIQNVVSETCFELHTSCISVPRLGNTMEDPPGCSLKNLLTSKTSPSITTHASFSLSCFRISSQEKERTSPPVITVQVIRISPNQIAGAGIRARKHRKNKSGSAPLSVRDICLA